MSLLGLPSPSPSVGPTGFSLENYPVAVNVVLGLITLASVVVAILARRDAHRSARATEAAARAAETSASVAKQAFDASMAPQWEAVGATQVDGSGQIAVGIRLVGPPGLNLLERIWITVWGDEHLRPWDGEPLTMEQRAEAVWGPYKFSPGFEREASLGHVAGPFAMVRGAPLVLDMQRSDPPPRYTNVTKWRKRYEITPIRLLISVERATGHEDLVILEVRNPDGTRPRMRRL